MAITRTAWIDDDGTGTTGTVINNAEKTLLYDQIDAALAGYLPAAGGTVSGPFTVGGVLTVSGLGTHRFSANGVGAGNILALENQSGAAGSYAQFQVKAGLAQGIFYAFSENYAPTSYITPNSAALTAAGPGGLALVAADPAGTIRFYSGGATFHWQLDAAGTLAPIVNGLALGSSTNGMVIYPYNNTAAGTVVVQVAAGYLAKQTSSARFKAHIAAWDLPSAARDRFLAVSPKLWDYTGQASGAAGFLAEDLDALGIENAYGRSVLVNYDADGRPESNRDYAILGLQHLVLQDLAARVAALEGR